MGVTEPRVRRRGFFLHSSDAEGGGHDVGEHENPEGVSVRVRTAQPGNTPRQLSSAGRHDRADARTEDSRPQIRSGSVTGSRQRAHLPR